MAVGTDSSGTLPIATKPPPAVTRKLIRAGRRPFMPTAIPPSLSKATALRPPPGSQCTRRLTAKPVPCEERKSSRPAPKSAAKAQPSRRWNKTAPGRATACSVVGEPRPGNRKRYRLPCQRLQTTIFRIDVKCFYGSARLVPIHLHAIGDINDRMEGMGRQSHGQLRRGRPKALPSARAPGDHMQRSRICLAKGADEQQAIRRSTSRRRCERRIGQKESRARPAQSHQKAPPTAAGDAHDGLLPWLHHLFLSQKHKGRLSRLANAHARVEYVIRVIAPLHLLEERIESGAPVIELRPVTVPQHVAVRVIHITA